MEWLYLPATVRGIFFGLIALGFFAVAASIINNILKLFRRRK